MVGRSAAAADFVVRKLEGHLHWGLETRPVNAHTPLEWAANHWLSVVREALGYMLDRIASDQGRDVEDWCRGCLPRLIDSFLATPWRKLLEIWCMNLHSEHNKQQQTRAQLEQILLDLQRDAEVVGRYFVELLLHYIQSPNNPWWTVKPIKDLLDETQPLFNNARQDVAEEPTLIRRGKFRKYGHDLMQSIRKEFLANGGLEKVGALLSHERLTLHQLHMVFDALKDLPWHYLTKRRQQDVTNLVTQLEASVNQMQLRRLGAHEADLPHHVGMQVDMLQRLSELWDFEDEDEFVVHGEYELTRDIMVQPLDRGPVTTLPKNSVVEITNVHTNYSGGHAWNISASTRETVLTVRWCGVDRGTLTNPYTPFHGKVLRPTRVPLEEARAVAEHARRGLCAACFAGQSGPQGPALVEQGILLLQKICQEVDKATGNKRNSMMQEFEEFLASGQILEALHRELLGKDRRRAEKASKVLSEHMLLTPGLEALLGHLLSREAMESHGGPMALPALALREWPQQGVLLKVLESVSNMLRAPADNEELRRTQVECSRRLLEFDRCWRTEPRASAELLLCAAWATVGAGQALAWARARESLVQEWRHRFRERKKNCMDSHREFFAIQLLARLRLVAEMHPARMYAGDLVEIRAPANFAGRSGVLRSPESLRALDGPDKENIVMLGDGTLVKCTELAAVGPRVAPARAGSEIAREQAQVEAQVGRHTVEEWLLRVPLILELFEAMLDGLQGAPQRSFFLPRSASKRSSFIKTLDKKMQSSGAGLEALLLTEFALFARSPPPAEAIAGAACGDEVEGVRARLDFLAYLFRHSDCLELTALGVIQFCEWFLLPPKLPLSTREEFLGWLRQLFASLPDPEHATPGDPLAGAVLGPDQATLAARFVLDLLQTGLPKSVVPEQLGCRGYFLYATLVLEVNSDYLTLVDNDGRACSARRLCAGLGLAPEGRGGGITEGSWVQVVDERRDSRPRDGVLVERINGQARWRIEYLGWPEEDVELGPSGGPDWRKLPDWPEQLPVVPRIHRVRAQSLEGLSGLWSIALFSKRAPIKAHAEALLFAIHRAQHRHQAAEMEVLPFRAAEGADVFFHGRWQFFRDIPPMLDPRTFHLGGPGTTLVLGSSLVSPPGWRVPVNERPYLPAFANGDGEEAAGEGPDAVLAGTMLLVSNALAELGTAGPRDQPFLKQKMLPVLEMLLSYIRATRIERSVLRSLQASGRGWGEVTILPRLYRYEGGEPEHVLPELTLPEHSTVQDIRRVLHATLTERKRRGEGTNEALWLPMLSNASSAMVKITISRTGSALCSENLALFELGLTHAPGTPAQEIDVCAPKPTAPKRGGVRGMIFGQSSKSDLRCDTLPDWVGDRQPPAEELASTDAWINILWRVCSLAAPGVDPSDDALATTACRVLWAIPPQKSLQDVLDSPMNADWAKLGMATADRVGGLWSALYLAALLDGRLAPPQLDSDADASLEQEAEKWRKEFLASIGWTWLTTLVLQDIPKPVPDAALETGVPQSLRAFQFLLHGATVANLAEAEADEDGQDGLQPEVLNKAFSAASIGLVLNARHAGAYEIANRCSAMLDDLLSGLQRPPPPGRGVKVSDEAAAGASRLRRSRMSAAMALVGCLQAAQESRADDRRVQKKVVHSFLDVAQMPGIEVHPLRRKALLALRSFCLRDRELRARLLVELAEHIETADTSEELAAVIAEVAFPGLSAEELHAPLPGPGLAVVAEADEDVDLPAEVSGLARLGAALGRNLFSSPDGKKATLKGAVASLRVLAKCLEHPGGYTIAGSIESAVPSDPAAGARGLAERILLQYVLLCKVPVTSSLRSLAGQVVLKLVASQEGQPWLPVVAHCTLDWVVQTEAPSRGWGEGLDWEYEPEAKALLRDSSTPVGLVNQGATCYMNSVLQQLYWMPSVRALMQRSGSEIDAAGILRELKNTFTQLERGARACHDPRNLVDACEALKLEFGVRHQNDAAEFFDKIMDYVQTKLVPEEAEPKKDDKAAEAPAGGEEAAGPPARDGKGKPESTPPAVSLAGLVKGSRVRKKRCLICGARTKVTEDPFFKLELPTRAYLSSGNTAEHGSIEECLEAMCSIEVMSGDNKVECEKACNYRRQDTEFETKLGILPPVLCLQLKRFDFDLRSGRQEKLNHRISFPIELDMRPYVAEAGGPQNSARGGKGGMKGQEPELLRMQSHFIEDPSADTNDRFRYVLRGIVIHSGAAGGGHFYSLVRVHSDNGKEQWYELNDSHVSRIRDEDIEDKYFGGPRSYRSAYMLVYSRASELEAATISGLRGIKEQPADGGRLVTLKVGTRVSIFSQRQKRWLHDGEVMESVPAFKGLDEAMGEDDELPGGEPGSADGRYPPGSVRVQYDGSSREKWVLPEHISNTLLMHGSAEVLELDLPEENGMEVGDEAVVRQNAAFSDIFLDFTKQLVETAIGPRLPAPTAAAATNGAECAPLRDAAPVQDIGDGRFIAQAAELAGICFFQLVPFVNWGRRHPDWEKLCSMACNYPVGAVGLLRAAMRMDHTQRHIHVLRLLLECPHKEAPELLSRLMRTAIEALPIDSSSRCALCHGAPGEVVEDPVAKFIHVFEDRIKTELGTRHAGMAAPVGHYSDGYGVPMNPLARWGEIAKCVNFLHSLTSSQQVAQSLANVPACSFPGILAHLVVQARRISLISHGGYFKNDQAAAQAGKTAASTLAHVLACLPHDATGCLSAYSHQEVAKEEVYEALWELKNTGVCSTLLRICPEDQILRRIIYHVRFDHRRPAPHGQSMDPKAAEPTTGSDDYQEQLDALDELMLMPPKSDVLPSKALRDRWQALSGAVSEFHAQYLIHDGLIRYKGHAGFCAVKLIHKVSDLGLRAATRAAEDQYITLEGAQQAIRETFQQQPDAWEQMATWLACRRHKCSVDGGKEQAMEALNDLARLLDEFNLRQIITESEKAAARIVGMDNQRQARQARHQPLPDSDDDLDHRRQDRDRNKGYFYSG